MRKHIEEIVQSNGMATVEIENRGAVGCEEQKVSVILYYNTRTFVWGATVVGFLPKKS